MTKQTNFKSLIAVVIFSLLSFACEGASVEVRSEGYEQLPSCLKSVCEVTMSKVLTETSANATFGTGLTYPTDGDSGNIWWDTIESDVQQLADRSQAAQELLGINSSNKRMIKVPLGTALTNTSTRFGSANIGSIYWAQNSVASQGLLSFEVPPLPIGAIITKVRARWGNTATTNVSITNKPSVYLGKSNITVGTSFVDGIGSPTYTTETVDPTSVLGTYQTLHDIDHTISETISENTSYAVYFKGEFGTNATAGGVLTAIYIEVSLP